MLSLARARSQARGGSPALPCSQITVEECVWLVPSTRTSVGDSSSFCGGRAGASPAAPSGARADSRSQKVDAPPGGRRGGARVLRTAPGVAADASSSLLLAEIAPWRAHRGGDIGAPVEARPRSAGKGRAAGARTQPEQSGPAKGAAHAAAHSSSSIRRGCLQASVRLMLNKMHFRFVGVVRGVAAPIFF
jgi:hypothetical protein